MSGFLVKNWQDYPNTTTPVSAAALKDIEARVAAYADALNASNAQISPLTVDTGAVFKIIMLSDGTVKAIPAATPAPTIPTGLAATPHLTSVALTWSATSGAVSYVVLRNGSVVGRPASPSFRDLTVALSATYSYTVSSVDQYGQRSLPSTAVTAFIDPALNQAPAVSIRCWPPTLPTNGRAIVRVNARDVDTQQLAIALSVNIGQLVPTNDPSVWTLTV